MSKLSSPRPASNPARSRTACLSRLQKMQRRVLFESLEDRRLMAGLDLAPIGTYETGLFAESATEIAAFDPASKRAFITSAAENLVRVVNLSNPANPVDDPNVPHIDLTSYGGAPNSVAVKNGVVAVAVEANDKTLPGSVVFFTTAGDYINLVVVGALPDMLTFTPDGKYVVVANEGEPNSYGQVDSVDPEGSVSIISLANGVANATVATADFSAFIGQEAALRAQGIRIFGPGANAAQDLEPEYVAISPDGTQAYVTLQENNALAIVDIASATVTSIEPLGFKDHNYTGATLETFTFQNMPLLGTVNGEEIPLGGFSGLTFEGYDAAGNLKFITHTDRGPNGEPTGINRPFLIPNFIPEIVRFTLNRDSGQLTITQRLQLKRSDGTPLTGLPNLNFSPNANLPYNDEIPVDVNGVPLNQFDPLGADLEGIVVDPNDGTFWMCDEYRPAIYHFAQNGRLIERFIPEGTHAAAGIVDYVPGTNGTFGIEALPAVIAQRRQNRGFEGIAYQNGKVYGIVQSPLRNPTSSSNGALNGRQTVRLVEFDPVTKTTTGQYLYQMDNPAVASGTIADKIGDLAADPNGGFLIVERDDDLISVNPLADIQKKIYKFNLTGATLVTPANDIAYDVGGGVMRRLDEMDLTQLRTIANVTPIRKTLHTDLAAIGYNEVSKVEGLTVLDGGTIAVINDNDFQVGAANEPIILGLINPLDALDASDRDGIINIRNWPVKGMYMPDAIASFEVGGLTYLVTANEGDARDYVGFSEEARVSSLTLDAASFAAQGFNDVTNGLNGLRNNSNLGRLTVTTTLGNTDGDADFDELYSFGGRSFSIWNAAGDLVYDSGDDFEQITAAAFPEFFNANHEDNDFDNRSDNKGPEPEAVVIGKIGSRTYAFIGLERIGGIMVYDVTNPTAPEFVKYVNNRDFTEDVEDGQPLDLGAEGLVFVSAEESPSGVPLILATNEVSGTFTVFAIDLPSGAQITDAGVLEIIGTSGPDSVNIRRQGSDLIVDANFLPNGSVRFPLAEVNSLYVILGSGNDWLRVDRNVTKPLTAEGNAGNDILFAGGGAATLLGQQGTDLLYSLWATSVLVGGDDNDFLYGGSSRNILIGGAGTDVLSGGNQQDILIGGHTSYDSNLVALETIRAFWDSQGSFNQRKSALQAGIPSSQGTLKLSVGSGTVWTDNVLDLVLSGPGQDWTFLFDDDIGS